MDENKASDLYMEKISENSFGAELSVKQFSNTGQFEHIMPMKIFFKVRN